MGKGDDTRAAVLDVAVAASSKLGLKGLTIGQLAESSGLSKSGLYAHFRSKEQLQLDVLDHATDRFVAGVVAPAIEKPRGTPRLDAIFDGWLAWDADSGTSLPGGCIFVAASAEFDDEPDGPVRDRVVEIQRQWLTSLARVVESGVIEGEFHPDTDCEQVAQDLYAIMLGFHVTTRLLRDPAAESRARTAYARLLQQIRTS
jgi:AcrR family transcriptional regulator